MMGLHLIQGIQSFFPHGFQLRIELAVVNGPPVSEMALNMAFYFTAVHVAVMQ